MEWVKQMCITFQKEKVNLISRILDTLFKIFKM